METKQEHHIFKTPHFIGGVFISFLLSNILYFIIEPQDRFLLELHPLLLAISLLTGILLLSLIHI